VVGHHNDGRILRDACAHVTQHAIHSLVQLAKAVFKAIAVDVGRVTIVGVAPQRVARLVNGGHVEEQESTRVLVQQLGFWSAGVGVGARLEPDDLGLGAELSGQLVFERLSVSARDPESAVEDSTGVNRLGGRVELTLFWRVWPTLGAIVGGDVHLLRPEVTVYERGRYVGLESSLGYVFTAGARFWP
jgi:hypothetical protein